MDKTPPETEKTPVGRAGKRRDADSAPVATKWEAGKGMDPNFAYQAFRAHKDSSLNEVRDKMRPRTLEFKGQDGQVVETVTVAGWEPCNREDDSVDFAKYRDDVGVGVDTLHYDGPHLLMKMPKADWDILQRHQEQRAALYEDRLIHGRQETFDIGGQQRPFAQGQKPATKITESPFQFGR